MNNTPRQRPRVSRVHAAIGFVLSSSGVAGAISLLLGLDAIAKTSSTSPQLAPVETAFTFGVSYHNDVSPPLRDLALLPAPVKAKSKGPENPRLPNHHLDTPDQVIQTSLLGFLSPSVPAPLLNFPGMQFPGVGCNCAPPDPTGAVGATQYVQMVNQGLQVFNKSNGNSVLGPVSISSFWNGFGGVCQSNGKGDPIVLYDHFADRWVITQFAGSGFAATDECIAVSTTSDATGTYHRYAFRLGTNFFDYPKLGVWRDAYYMSMNVFTADGSAFLGPQPFALDRTAMLAGLPATFVSPVGPMGAATDTFLPADVDGPTLPPAGAPGTFISFPGNGSYTIYHLHVDFAMPSLSTWSTYATLPAAGFTMLCPTTRACVPQLGATGSNLDGIGDRLMHRAAYRNFGSHESLVGNFSVSANGVAGIRWFELRNVTAGPAVIFQESTYRPDTTWRWMGSAAMDGTGNLAIGFSASSATINPQIRYAGRQAGDPLNTLGQGERTLHAGTGSQIGTGNRWGDYSALTIDPVDDTTFWFTSQYYDATSEFNWRTRIGSFNLLPFNDITSSGSSVVAAGSNGLLDAGETVTVSLSLRNTGTTGLCTTAGLSGELLTTGGVTSPSPPSRNYGVVCSGAAATSREFTFTVDSSLKCGDPVTVSLVVTDGATNYGTLTYTFNTGTPTVTFAQNFDGLFAPNLPAGWTAGNAQGAAPLWITSNNTPDQPPNTAFVDDPANVSDKRLESPGIHITSTAARLSFRNFYALDAVGTSRYDGGVLEISSPNINGGAFTDIADPAVGGSFLSGGYVGRISSSFGNPLAGRMAWSGNSGGYLTTSVNLGPNVAGQTIKLRFRMGSDNSTASTGWRVDSLSVTEFACAPGLQRVVSRKTHGPAGPYDVDLPLAGDPGIECRTGGANGDHTLVFTFAEGLASVQSASVTAGIGSISSRAIGSDSHEYIVNLTGVSNSQTLTVGLANVSDIRGNHSASVTASIAVLAGDTTHNGSVNSADIGQTKSQSGATISLSNFRQDVTANGALNAADISLVKSQSGTVLP